MTVAFCWKCGEEKSGVFSQCPECNVAPTTENDAAVSVLLTDHYFDTSTLRCTKQDISDGVSISLSPEQRLMYIRMLRDIYFDKPEEYAFEKAIDVRYKPGRYKKIIYNKPWWRRIMFKIFG
jgi:hypothetical protein